MTARLTTILTLVAASALLVACGEKRVEEEELETQVKTTLTSQTGTTPSAVDCPSDLEAKVGTTLICKVTADGQTQDAEIKVTSVDDDRALFSVELQGAQGAQATPTPTAEATEEAAPPEEEAMEVNPSSNRVEEGELEQQIAVALENETGVAPAQVRCPGPLKAEIGATQNCGVDADDGTSIDATVTVTAVEGDRVLFDIETAG